MGGLALGASAASLIGCSKSAPESGAATGATASGGGAASTQKYSLDWWQMENTPEGIAGYKAITEPWNAANPNFLINQQPVSWADAYTKLTSAISAGTPPELAMTIPDFTVTMKQTGALQPVDDIVEELDKTHKFIKPYLTPYFYDGHYWAVPAFGMNHSLWYRKDRFAEAGVQPPTRWEDLLGISRALTRGDQYGLALPASTHMYTTQAVYDMMIIHKDEHLMDENGNIIFDNPITVDVFRQYQELWQYSPRDTTNWTFAEPIASFMNGTSAMVVHMGFLFALWEALSGKAPEDLGAMPIPQPAGGQRGSISYSNGIMVFTKDPEKRKIITEYLRWLYDPERTGAWLSNMTPGLFLPVTEDASLAKGFWGQEMIAKYKPIVEMVIDNSRYGKLFGFTHDGKEPHPGIGRISGDQVLAKAVQEMLINGRTPEEAVKWGADQMRSMTA